MSGLDILTTSLANFDHISLVERERIQDIIAELELQASSLTEKDGARIGRLLNADKVPLCSVSALAAPLADALVAAHEAGIVHRDLKPGNIMLDP